MTTKTTKTIKDTKAPTKTKAPGKRRRNNTSHKKQAVLSFEQLRQVVEQNKTVAEVTGKHVEVKEDKKVVAPPLANKVIKEEVETPRTPRPVEDITEEVEPEKVVKRKKFTLTTPQQTVVDDVKNWFITGTGYSKHEFSGYAGTGKSTVIEEILEELPVRKNQVRLCAPTGTASLVLQDKTPGYACSTLHRLFYKLEEGIGGKREFEPTSDNLHGIKLVVLDEGYMAGKRTGEDIIAMCKEARVKLLVVGDRGQLGPVKDDPYFLSEPESMLTDVMRQAADSPIIALSMKIREATERGVAYQFPAVHWNVKDKVFLRHRSEISVPRLAKVIKEGGAIITGVNKTRKSYNAAIRRELGFTSPHLMEGETIVVKDNMDVAEEGGIAVTNGMRGIVTEVKRLANGLVSVRFSPEMFKGSRILTINEDVLFERTTVKEINKKNFFNRGTGKKEINPGDDVRLGYVITAHASQGAQWPTVFVFNESGAFGRGPDGYISINQWLYTAVTRAIERLVILR